VLSVSYSRFFLSRFSCDNFLPRRALFPRARYRPAVASCLHPRILTALYTLSLPLFCATGAGSQLACGPAQRLPGAGWRGPLEPERLPVARCPTGV